MVEDLNHLQKGGRISKTAAVIGTMVQIKPIICLDNEGKLQIIRKERGRKKGMNKIVDMAVEACEGKMPGYGDGPAWQLSGRCSLCRRTRP